MANAKGLDLLHKQQEFSGCKIALICDDKLPTILRDDKEAFHTLICGSCRAVEGGKSVRENLI